MERTFKERVCQSIIEAATQYKLNFLDYEYLIYSDQFQIKKHYIISAQADNFLHLTGVNTFLSARKFFAKSISGKLTESDFNFIKAHQSEKSVKGCVRRKIHILSKMMSLMSQPLIAEERFHKNKVFCSLATSDGSISLGFVDTGTLRPKSLLEGNELSSEKAVAVTRILRRRKGTKKFLPMQ